MLSAKPPKRPDHLWREAQRSSGVAPPTSVANANSWWKERWDEESDETRSFFITQNATAKANYNRTKANEVRATNPEEAKAYEKKAVRADTCVVGEKRHRASKMDSLPGGMVCDKSGRPIWFVPTEDGSDPEWFVTTRPRAWVDLAKYQHLEKKARLPKAGDDCAENATAYSMNKFEDYWTSSAQDASNSDPWAWFVNEVACSAKLTSVEFFKPEEITAEQLLNLVNVAAQHPSLKSIIIRSSSLSASEEKDLVEAANNSVSLTFM